MPDHSKSCAQSSTSRLGCDHYPSNCGGSPRPWPTANEHATWPASSASVRGGSRRSARSCSRRGADSLAMLNPRLSPRRPRRRIALDIGGQRDSTGVPSLYAARGCRRLAITDCGSLDAVIADRTVAHGDHVADTVSDVLFRPHAKDALRPPPPWLTHVAYLASAPACGRIVEGVTAK